MLATPENYATGFRNDDAFDIAWDDKGHFIEPHLSTLAVRPYLTKAGEPTLVKEAQVKTLGPHRSERHIQRASPVPGAVDPEKL